jgi:PAS domain S-box-containing protein
MSERPTANPEDLNRFRAALSAAPVTLFTQDLELRYTAVHNPVFSNSDRILGRTDADFLPDPGAALLTGIKAEVLATGIGLRREVRLETPVGVKFYDLTLEPTRDEGGRVNGIAGTALDVTERVEAEAARRNGEESLRLAQENAGIGIHDYDPVSGKIHWDSRVRSFWGVSPDEEVTFDLFLAGLHPEDRAPTLEAVDRAFDPAGNGRYYAEYRVVNLRDGIERWVAATGNVTFLEGKPIRLVGTVHDVTARKGAEEALRASEERFRLAADAVNGIIYDYDPKTGHVERTRGLAEVLGYRPEEVPAKAEWWWEQMHPDDRPDYGRIAEKEIPDRSTNVYRVRHKDGRWLHVEDRAVLLRGPDGSPLRMVGCTVDVTDRKRAEAALREADRRKDEFLATLAHELRNPLAPIRNAVEILMARAQADPKLVWARELIDRQVRVMARLLDDLLDVSRITRDKLELRKEKVLLAEVVASAVETSRPLIDAAGHALALELPDEPVVLDADPVRLAQVLSNLLNNAAKYTDPGGHIRLTAERSGDHVQVSVADDGIGIAPEMLPRLFEIFSQAEPSHERTQGGLGIGLSLVRGLVELHGGTIRVHSEGPGRGSVFTVRLPGLAAAPAKPPPAIAAPPAAPQFRLLIADDLADSADSLAMLMELMGHEVRTAYNGEEAVALAAEFRPHVALIDLGMPKLTGIEVCRRIRREPWGGQVRLVAVTGWGQDADRKRTHDAGFDHHLTKPVDPADMERLLTTLTPAPAC